MNEKTINLNQIKLDKNHRFPIEKKIEIGEDVLITMKACCFGEDVRDNQDGTVNVTYVLKPIEVIIDKKVIHLKS